LLDRQLNLLLHLLGQVVSVLDADAACIHQLNVSAVGLDKGRHTVARYAGGWVNDTDASAGQPIKERGLADVWPARHGDERDRHKRYSDCEKLVGKTAPGPTRGARASFVRILNTNAATHQSYWLGTARGGPMARCEQGYRCDVCGQEVEAINESDLYLR